MYMCFSKTPALSPTGDARPFDAAGDGTILGEGLGMRRAEAPRRRRARRRPHLRRHQGRSARRATARATRSTPRAPAGQVKALRERLRAGRRDARTRSSWSRRTAPARRSATPPRSTALTEVYRAAEPDGPLVRPRLGQVADRPHQGRRRRRRADQGGAGAAPQGAAADDQGDAAARRRCSRADRRSTSTPRRGPGCRAPTTRAARPSAPSASAAATSTASWRSTGPQKPAIDWDGDVQIARLLAPTTPKRRCWRQLDGLARAT